MQPSVAQINVCREGGAAGGAGDADAAAAATAAATTAAAGVLAAATAAIACRAGVGAGAFKSGGWDVDVDAASAGESTRNFSPRSSLRVRPSGNAYITTSECTQQFVVSFATKSKHWKVNSKELLRTTMGAVDWKDYIYG